MRKSIQHVTLISRAMSPAMPPSEHPKSCKSMNLVTPSTTDHLSEISNENPHLFKLSYPKPIPHWRAKKKKKFDYEHQIFCCISHLPGGYSPHGKKLLSGVLLLKLGTNASFGGRGRWWFEVGWCMEVRFVSCVVDARKWMSCRNLCKWTRSQGA